jgi:hypothetical protein
MNIPFLTLHFVNPLGEVTAPLRRLHLDDRVAIRAGLKAGRRYYPDLMLRLPVPGEIAPVLCISLIVRQEARVGGKGAGAGGGG